MAETTRDRHVHLIAIGRIGAGHRRDLAAAARARAAHRRIDLAIAHGEMVVAALVLAGEEFDVGPLDVLGAEAGGDFVGLVLGHRRLRAVFSNCG